MNENNHKTLNDELKKILDGKTEHELELLVRSFTTYFRLVNLAENVHRARRVKESEFLDANKSRNSLVELKKLISEKKVTSKELESFLEKLEIVPTLTAHKLREYTQLPALRLGDIIPKRSLQIDEFGKNFDNSNHSHSFFDSSLMLSESRGFDIIIGNPPYNGLSKNKDNWKSFRRNSSMAIWLLARFN